MSLELRSSERDALKALWLSWLATPNTELEATVQKLDYTGFLDIIRYLRSIGLTEVAEEPRLHIFLSGGLRFTLVGEGTISRYCQDNSLRDKQYEVILKEKKTTGVGGISDIDLKDYDVRVKVRREQGLKRDNPRVLEALSKWDTLPKSFRHMKRYSFTSAQHTGLQFDASIVRENRKDRHGNHITHTTFTGSQLSRQPLHYEMEVEALRNSSGSLESFVLGVTSLLRGLQNSYVLVRNSVKQGVLDYMTAKTEGTPRSFPGSQPVTLRKAHLGMDPESDTPSLRDGDYNVTDKADGMRCLLLVTVDGRIYLIDRNLRVYGTDRMLDATARTEWAGTVLDGEWVTHDRENKPLSNYLAFDIFNGRRGEVVSTLPFYSRAESAAGPAPHRLEFLKEAVAALGNATYLHETKIPAHRKLSIDAKQFRMATKLPDKTGALFKVAAETLERSRLANYHTDGLIFTPNAAPLPRHVKTWKEQFKWKPASMNSVDFLVTTEKERTAQGRLTGAEVIRTQYREDTKTMVRFKTLRLFVASSKDDAFIDPRFTVLHMKPLPTSLDARGEYRPIEFSPQPPDPMGSVCYVEVTSDEMDEEENAIYCEETGDPISDRTIVEMSYEPTNPPGWRWIPMRVRWDKTELFARREMAMNNDAVANDVWNSIHDPITESMIRTGSLTETEAEAAEGSAAGGGAAADAGNDIYYMRKASQRDLMKVSGLARFHNQYIKSQILLGSTMVRNGSLLDMSVGQAGDIHKWIHGDVGFVLGCDLAKTGLLDPQNGAYRRYLNEIIKMRGGPRGGAPKMIFVNANSAEPYKDGTAGINSKELPQEKAILRALWRHPKEEALPEFIERNRGIAASGFDVVSLMFTLHYFFKDKATVDGFLSNVNDTLKPGGYFVGCCFDGDRVAHLLRDLPVGGIQRGIEDGRDIWSITKQYEDATGSVPATDEGIGRAIDVYFVSIGEARREYLVSFAYLVQRLAAIGVELLTPEECAKLRLSHSTNLFSESYAMAKTQKQFYEMSPTVETFSFLNRWFIFRRRTTAPLPPDVVTRGIPPTVAAAPPGSAVPLPQAAVATVGADAVEAVASSTAPRLEIGEPAAAPVEGDAGAAEAAEAAEAVEAEEAAKAAPPQAGGVHADGPVFQFYHKSGAKDDLKIGDKNWRRYLSPYHPFSYKDPRNTSIVYPSLEAAMGAAKFALATDKPELGAQLFSVTGNIAQETATKRAAVAGRPDDLAALAEEEGNKMRDAQKLAAFRKVKAKFNAEAWEEHRQAALVEYVHQRFVGDKHLREILEAVGQKKGRLVYYTAGTNELGGTVKDDAIEGENLLGRAYLHEIGFQMA